MGRLRYLIGHIDTLLLQALTRLEKKYSYWRLPWFHIQVFDVFLSPCAPLVLLQVHLQVFQPEASFYSPACLNLAL